MQANVPGATGAPASDFTAALYTFLDVLSESMIGRLYEAPASCLSIFRSVPHEKICLARMNRAADILFLHRLLPPTARHIVLDMLWYDRELTRVDVALWVRERRSDGVTGGERRYARSYFSSRSNPLPQWEGCLAIRPIGTIISTQAPTAFANQGRSHPLGFCRRHLTTALSALARLHILTEKSQSHGDPLLVLHDEFRTNLKFALTGG